MRLVSAPRNLLLVHDFQWFEAPRQAALSPANRALQGKTEPSEQARNRPPTGTNNRTNATGAWNTTAVVIRAFSSGIQGCSPLIREEPIERPLRRTPDATRI